MFWGSKIGSVLKSFIKWSLKIYNVIFLELNINLKHKSSPFKPLLHSTQSLILGVTKSDQNQIQDNKKLWAYEATHIRLKVLAAVENKYKSSKQVLSKHFTKKYWKGVQRKVKLP